MNIKKDLNTFSIGKKTISKEAAILMILTLCGLLLRLVYIYRIPYNVNQHDAGNFSSGHIGYIFYLIEHNWHLPDFNPTTVWSFYHPPLHHYLAAIVAKISMLFGAGQEAAMENVQFLTVFYGMISLLLSYKILKKFNVRGFSLILPYALLIFHPSLIMLGGSINNDALCLVFMLLTIYTALIWYEAPNKRSTILLALIFAGMVLTKLSGLLLAPAVALLFLAKFIKEKNQRKNILLQGILFCLICIPLALSFSIRNLILWHVNPFFTLDLGDYLYTGNNILERVFLLHREQFASPFVIYNVTPDNMLAVDRNIVFYLLKTSLFGDKFFLTADSPFIFAAWALHLVNFLLILLSLICMIAQWIHIFLSILKEKRILPYMREIFLFVLYGCSAGSFLLFCFRYPNACSQDFRYVQLTLFLHMTFLAIFLHRFRENKKPLQKALKAGFLILTIVFALLTTLLICNCSRI